MRESYKKADSHLLARGVALDAWIIHHFRVLPTDERFERLTDRQKDLLFCTFVELPTEEESRELYLEQKRNREFMEDGGMADDLRNLGYNEDQITDIMRDIASARHG